MFMLFTWNHSHYAWKVLQNTFICNGAYCEPRFKNVKIVKKKLEMTLNYWVMLERYPNLEKRFYSECEISSLLDIKLAMWSTTSCALAMVG